MELSLPFRQKAAVFSDRRFLPRESVDKLSALICFEWSDYVRRPTLIERRSS
jgi:hypothetical protein